MLVCKKIISLFGKLVGYIFPYVFLRKLSLGFDVFYSNWVSSGIRQVGSNCVFSSPFFLVGGNYISIGNNFRAERGLRLEAFPSSGESSLIVVGNNVSISYDCHIGASNYLCIGNGVLIGSKVFITDHSHGEISGEALKLPPVLREIVSKGAVIIEDNVWIGESVAILPNVTIGKNAIIGANSVVTKSIPPNCVACGNPAKVVKML